MLRHISRCGGNSGSASPKEQPVTCGHLCGRSHWRLLAFAEFQTMPGLPAIAPQSNSDLFPSNALLLGGLPHSQRGRLLEIGIFWRIGNCANRLPLYLRKFNLACAAGAIFWWFQKRRISQVAWSPASNRKSVSAVSALKTFSGSCQPSILWIVTNQCARESVSFWQISRHNS